MKCRIMSETNGRLRVRMIQYRMTFDQADILQYYLEALPGVRKVKVYDRTRDAVVLFEPSVREDIVKAFSEFDYVESQVAVPAHTDRALQREFETVAMAIRRECLRYRIPVLDGMKVLPRQAGYFNEDGIHPNDEGFLVYALHLTRVLSWDAWNEVM